MVVLQHYFTELDPLLLFPFKSLYKMHKKNKQNQWFLDEPSNYDTNERKKFSRKLWYLNHATFRNATKIKQKILYILIIPCTY